MRIKPLFGALFLPITLAACSHSANLTTTSSTSTSTTATGTSTSATSSPVATTTKPSIGRCTRGNLSAAKGSSQGAAGTIAAEITFTNVGTSTCTLDGYPGLQLLSSTGAALPTNVVRGGAAGASVTPSNIALVTNGKASFVLSFSDVPTGNQTTCPNSAQVEITPPNDFGYLTIPLVISPCDSGKINVSAVFAGTQIP
ncbi:MAG: DUF4232 domain-containing protein [Acidimicrobiales bacterium]|nr:DUF4232 domain-containing protein [Acidimicrobiales bacterium]